MKSIPQINCLASLACTVGGLLIPTSLWSQVLVFDFEDGTAGGWTTVSSDPNVPHAFTPTNALTENGETLPTPSSGTFQMLPLEFENPNGVTNTRDGSHTTLLIRSPEFVLNRGPLSIAMVGGTASGALPAAPSDLASATNAADGLHVKGFGLRRVSDDTYVATGSRSANGNGYQDVVLSAATLAPFVSETETYTLDVFDSFGGGWGWIGFDNVQLPGAGSYFQDFEGFADGTTDLSDGSILTSNRTPVVGIWDNALRLTSDSLLGTVSSYITPPIQHLRTGFRARFDYKIIDAPNETINDLPADGFSFNVGAISHSPSAGEEGFGTGLSIEFDTYLNAAPDIIGHNVGVDGIDVPGGRNDTDPHVDGRWHSVCIEWIDGAVSMTVDDAALFHLEPTPGFTPAASDVFAFAARTGGATETVLIDNISITPPDPIFTPELVVPLIGVVQFDGIPNTEFEFISPALLRQRYGPAASSPPNPFALLAHDDDFLYIGARIPENSLAWGDPASEIRFYFDPSFSRLEQPGADHWYLSIKPYAANIDPQWFRGDGSGGFTRVISPPFQWNALVDVRGDVTFEYHYEIRVSRDFLGSWDEIDGFAIEHREPGQSYPAPDTADLSSPATWARLTYSNSSPDLARAEVEGTVQSRQLGSTSSGLSGQEVILSVQGLSYKVETDATGNFEFDVPIPSQSEILIQLGSHAPLRLDRTITSASGIRPIALREQDPREAFRFPGCPAGTTCTLAALTFKLLEPPSVEFTMTDIRRREAPVIALDDRQTMESGDDRRHGGLFIDSGRDGLNDTVTQPGDFQIVGRGDGRRTAWPAVILPSDGTAATPASTLRIEGTNLHSYMTAYLIDNEVFGTFDETYRLEFVAVDSDGTWIDFRMPVLTPQELQGYAFLRLRDDWLRPGVTSAKTVTQEFAFVVPPFPVLRGFGWENEGATSSKDEFLAVYGDNAYRSASVNIGIRRLSVTVPDPFYHVAWWKIYKWINPGGEGLCVGMVSSSLLRKGSTGPTIFGEDATYLAELTSIDRPARFEYSGSLGAWTGPPRPTNMLGYIQMNHGVQTSSQYLESWLLDLARGPFNVRNDIRTGLSSSVVCFKPSGDWTGHCVAPFDVHLLETDKSLFEIYDPNYPGEVHYLSVGPGGYRLVGDEAKWENNIIAAAPLSIWRGPRNHPLNIVNADFAIELIYSLVSGAAEPLYEDSQDRQWGWDVSGQFIDTIPGVTGIPVFDTPSRERRNVPVLIPADSGPIEIAATSRGGEFGLHAGVGGVAFSLDVAGALTGEKDTLMTSGGGPGTIELAYRPARPRQGLAPILGMEMGDSQSAVFQLSAVEAGPAGGTAFKVIAADRCIEVMNAGPAYGVQIDSADGETGRVASLEFGPFVVPPGALHRLEIANWPAATLLRSSVDADGDGNFETVELVRGRRNPNGLFAVIAGDMDLDGVVNAGDVEPLTTAVNFPGDFALLYPDSDIALGDLDGDGIVDQTDLDTLLGLIALGNPAPAIDVVELVAESGVRVEVSGLPGQRYELQASQNLKDWEGRQVKENISGHVEFTESIVGFPDGYFRILVLD